MRTDANTPIGRDHAGTYQSDGSPENSIRVLPGVKRFSDGTTLDCPVHDIALRRIADIREFKFYDQPNLELGRDTDSSVTVGTLRNIRLEDLTFSRPGIIELHAKTDGFVLHNVELNHPLQNSPNRPIVFR